MGSQRVGHDLVTKPKVKLLLPRKDTTSQKTTRSLGTKVNPAFHSFEVHFRAAYYAPGIFLVIVHTAHVTSFNPHHISVGLVPSLSLFYRGRKQARRGERAHVASGGKVGTGKPGSLTWKLLLIFPTLRKAQQGSAMSPFT